jgi:hypothetical protein
MGSHQAARLFASNSSTHAALAQMLAQESHVLLFLGFAQGLRRESEIAVRLHKT